MSEKSKKSNIKYYGSIVLALFIIAIFIKIRVFPKPKWSLKLSQPKQEIKTQLTQKEIRNVVLISIDTLRADHLSCYGYPKKTSPNIDAFAKDAVLFNHAVTPVPLTMPAHSSMMTGTTPLYHKVHDNGHRLSESNITLAELLKQKDFATAAFIGAAVLDSQFGLDQGFDTYDDFLPDKTMKKRVFYNERKGQEVTNRANQWLDKNKDQKFFLFLHYFDVHAPYVKHSRFALPFDRYLYDGEIVYTDRQIGRVINKLKELDLYESSIIIIAADHGESLSEHDEKTHGFLVYHPTIHVPLIIRMPGGLKSIKINDTVGLIDILPTICRALNISIPEHIQGKDLGIYFSGKKTSNKERYFFCESLLPTLFNLGPVIGLTSGRFKYIHTAEPELYDLLEDPSETKNLFDHQPEQVRIMQQQLRAVLEDNNLKDIVPVKAAMGRETVRKLQALGYVATEDIKEEVQFEQKSVNPKKFIEV